MHHRSVARRATPAPAIHTLNILILFQLILRHPADTRRSEIRLLGLNTSHTAKLHNRQHCATHPILPLLFAPIHTYLLIPLLLPLGNQRRIAIPILEQPVVQLSAYGLFLVVHVVDIAASLVRYLEDGPDHFVLFLAFSGRVFSVFHLVGEFEEGVFQVVEAVWRGFFGGARGADGWHFGSNCTNDMGEWRWTEETY
jgi:hypothetical protein